MATVTVVRAQPITPPIAKIVLELSPLEAQRLRNFLCNSNVGTPENRAKYDLYQGVYLPLHRLIDGPGE